MERITRSAGVRGARCLAGIRNAAALPRGKTAALIRFALTVCGAFAVAFVVWWKVQDGIAIDAHAYWSLDLADPYSSALTSPTDAFLYSPAIAQGMSLFALLPWGAFMPLWTGLSALALVVIAGPFTLLVLFTEPVLYELDLGNINLLLGLAIAAGFRWPATWAFVLLTKVTPGVCLVWFAARREWRYLIIALGVTAAITAVSFALAPGLWVAWLSTIPNSPLGPQIEPTIPLPLRIVAAVVLVTWGARSDRRWVLPIAALVAMPVLRYAELSILVACIPLVKWPGLHPNRLRLRGSR